MDLDSESWFNCNDSHTSKISRPDNSSASAYVLFYIQAKK